jgi:hypothetical protein
MGKALLWPPLACQRAGRVVQSLLLRSITVQDHFPSNNALRFAQFLYRQGGIAIAKGKGVVPRRGDLFYKRSENPKGLLPCYWLFFLTL